MVDLTMGKGEGCPLKETCYRVTATPDELQSWFMEVPYDHKDNKCDHYMDTQRRFAKTVEK